MTKPRCAWCHRSVGDLQPLILTWGRERESVFVHGEHAAPVVAWHAALVSTELSLTTSLALLPLVLLATVGVAAIVSPRLVLAIVGILLIALAVAVWRHPFLTRQTVTLVGLRRSLALARALATALGVIGSLTLAAGLWIVTVFA